MLAPLFGSRVSLAGYDANASSAKTNAMAVLFWNKGLERGFTN